LRVIEEKKYEPLGSEKPISIDVRIIAATNKNLRGLITKNKFREDLFFKLNVIPMIIHPLRERKEDIPFLINYFLKNFSIEFGKKQKTMSKEAMEAFTSYSWPGNISELINVIERFVIMVPDDEIKESHLSLLVEPREIQYVSGINQSQPLDEAKIYFEMEYIHNTLIRNNWNLSKSAAELNIEKEALRKKIMDLGIKFLG